MSLGAHDDVLRHLDPTRREFVKGLIAATGFVTPLVASFSLDGLTIESAEAMHLSNQACLSATEYVGPRNYLAALYSIENPGDHGMADLRVENQGARLQFRLKFSSGVVVDAAQIVRPGGDIRVAWALFPDGSFNPYDVLAELVGLEGQVDAVVAGSPCSFAGMLQEMAAGHSWVRVTTTDGHVIAGQITPQGGAGSD